MKLPGKIPLRFLGATLTFLLCISQGVLGNPGSSRITGMDVRAGNNEIELKVDGAIEYGYFPLSDPDRLVFDFPGATLDINNGEMLTQEVEASCFREIRVSQFSTDPWISRLVLMLVQPAEALVTFDPNSGKLLIQVKATNGGTVPSTGSRTEAVNLLFAATPPNETASSAPVTTSTTTPIDPAQAFDLTKTASEVIVAFPQLSSDNIRVTQLRFPDRLHIRMFTGGTIGDARPRFDILDRGNIWNNIAKQWTSYLDRDGLSVVDLTIYLYRNAAYTQTIRQDGVPEVRIFAGESGLIQPGNASVTNPVAEVEVDGYPQEPAETVEEQTDTEIPATQDAGTAPPEATVQEPSEVQVFFSEEGTEESENAILVTETVETVEVIENGSLVTGIPEGAMQEAPTTSIAQTGFLHSTELPILPVTIAQENLLAGGGRDLEREPLSMRVGEVVVVRVRGLVRASMGNPEVATLNVISQEEILVTALAPGNTTMMIWEEGGRHKTRQVSVLAATAAREEEIASLIGDESVSVKIITSGDSGGTPGVVLEGVVQTEEERARAASIAALYAGERVTNLIEVSNPRQVLVKIRVVEVDKRALDEHLSQFSAAARTDNDDFTVGIITNLLDPANPGGGLFDSRVRPGIVNGEARDVVFDPIDMVLNELESNREANVLSEPNVVSLSGHPAHFRVGGEIPYTYQNESGVTVVEFKEFGISVDMTPLVDSQNNIMLNVKPVVRTIDMALAISGIPGFRTREMDTVVQLRPGETLVIGGLIQNEITKIISEVPILSQIPILGELFRSKRFNEDKTELVIFLTPYVLEDAASSEGLVGIFPESSAQE